MKLKIFSTVIITLLMVILLPLVIVLYNDTEFNVYDSFINNDSLSNCIVFLSDTQDPIWIETILLNENNNIEIKNSIFEKISEQNPRAIFHMGDLVALGFLNRDWKEIDEWVNELNRNGISFYPALGNHELLLFPEMGYANYVKRFPEYSKTGYLIKLDSVAIIMLNSNFGFLAEKEIIDQNEWYEESLKKLDEDDSVKLIIVGCHHSPYTNSTIVGPSTEVQKIFVPPYLRSKKAGLFLSGHAHAFEHFNIDGKDFVVIGGGGGLQQPLLVGEESLWDDKFPIEESIRRFHFTLFEKEGNSYFLNVRMIDSTYSKFEDIYRIEL